MHLLLSHEVEARELARLEGQSTRAHTHLSHEDHRRVEDDLRLVLLLERVRHEDVACVADKHVHWPLLRRMLPNALLDLPKDRAVLR